MSLKPMFKKCRKCGRMYDYNPSVGTVKCPYCREEIESKIEKTRKLIKERKTDNEEKEEEN